MATEVQQFKSKKTVDALEFTGTQENIQALLEWLFLRNISARSVVTTTTKLVKGKLVRDHYKSLDIDDVGFLRQFDFLVENGNKVEVWDRDTFESKFDPDAL